MALITIIYGDAADGTLHNSFATNDLARDTTPAETVSTTGTTARVGQGFQTYACDVIFGAFDTSIIADDFAVNAATLSFVLESDTSSADFIVQARLYDWGTTLTTADWVVGNDLAGKTLLATLATNGIGATGAYKNFTENGTNFQSAINKTGFTRFLLVSDHQTDNIAPGAPAEFVTLRLSDQAGTTSDPKLSIYDDTPGWRFIAASTAAEVASGNLTLNAPAGAAQGKLLVACIAYRSTPAFTLPADWTLVATQQSSGDTDATNGIASGVMAYIVQGASPPSYVFTRTAGDVARGAVVCYGDNHATPYDTGSAATLGADSATVTTGTITTAEDGELIVAMVSCGDNLTTSAFDAATDPATASGATDTTTDPTANTWIERHDSGTGTGADTAIAIADAIRATAGATGTIQATVSASARHVMIAGAFKVTVLAVAASLVFNPFPFQPYLVR